MRGGPSAVRAAMPCVYMTRRASPGCVRRGGIGQEDTAREDEGSMRGRDDCAFLAGVLLCRRPRHVDRSRVRVLYVSASLRRFSSEREAQRTIPVLPGRLCVWSTVNARPKPTTDRSARQVECGRGVVRVWGGPGNAAREVGRSVVPRRRRLRDRVRRLVHAGPASTRGCGRGLECGYDYDGDGPLPSVCDRRRSSVLIVRCMTDTGVVVR